MKVHDYSAVIFDLGGVILDLDYNKTTQAFIDLGIENFDHLYSQANQENLFDLIETGKISGQHFINKLLQMLPPGTSANKVVHAWNAMLLHFPSRKLDLLMELKQSGKRTFLLSNTNEIHLTQVNRLLAKVSSNKLSDYFEKVYLSHEVHLRKPDRAIFEHVLEEGRLNRSDVLFIDDSIQHILGANEVGLTTFHLEDTSQFYDLFS